MALPRPLLAPEINAILPARFEGVSVLGILSQRTSYAACGVNVNHANIKAI
jgi:hypothetical protein